MPRPPVRRSRKAATAGRSGSRRPARPPAARSAAQRDLAFQRLVGEVFRLNGQLLTTAESLASGMGVSPAGWQTIAVLREGPLTVAEVGRRLGLRRQSAQHNVNRLVRQGLVALRDNPQHRRARLATLTRRGKSTMTRLRTVQGRLTALFLADAPLTATDLAALATLLQRLRESAASRETASASRPAGGSRRRHSSAGRNG